MLTSSVSISKMGLKGVPGIRYVKPEASEVNHGQGSAATYTSASKKRPGPLQSAAGERAPNPSSQGPKHKRPRQGKEAKNVGGAFQ